MAELINFIGNKTFEEVKASLKELNIGVKSTHKLYMVLFGDNSDFSDPRVRQATGMILEKETNKLVHYSFEKCYEGFDNDWVKISQDPYPKSKMPDDYSVELFFEGSIIKLFYYDGMWNTATSKNIEAHTNTWTSTKTFDLLFAEGVYGTHNITYREFLDSLDKDYCYTYILQHPENILGYPVADAGIYYVNKVNRETLEEERPLVELRVSKTIDEILEDNNQNYMVYFTENNKLIRVKVLTDSFTNMTALRGNYPDIGLTYLTHINEHDKRLRYREVFFMYSQKFNDLDKKFDRSCETLYKLYIDTYVRKEEPYIPKQYIRSLKQLHGQYRKTKKPITFEDVTKKLSELDPGILSYVISYKK